MSQERKASGWRQRHNLAVARYRQLIDSAMSAIERVLTMREEFGPHWHIYLYPERTDEVKSLLFNSQMNHEARDRAIKNLFSAKES